MTEFECAQDMETIAYNEHVARLRRLREDEAVRDDYAEFRAAAWFFELDKFVQDDDIQAVWDRRPPDVDFVDEDADAARKLQAEFGFVSVNFDSIDEPKSQEWLYNRLIPVGGYYGNISATEGLGKTGLAQDVSVQMVLGMIQLSLSEGDTVAPDPRVLYLDYENPEGTYDRRLRMMPYEGLRDVYKHLFYTRVNLGDIRPLDTYEGGQDVLTWALRCDADLVIIDTKTSSVEGRNNQDSTEYDFYTHTVRPLTERGTTVLVLDHVISDPKRPGGSKAKTQKLDFFYTLEKVKEYRNKDGELDVTDMVLTLRKDRANKMPPKIYIRRTSNPYQHELSMKPFKPLRMTAHTDAVGTNDRVAEMLKEKFPDGKVGINEGYRFLTKDQNVTGTATKLKAIVKAFKEETAGSTE